LPCPFHPPNVIILTIPGKEQNLWSSSLCSFLQPPVTSFLIPLRLKFSHRPVLKNLQSVFLFQCQRRSFTPIQNHEQNYISLQ
jgi:hypothetical protein